MDPFYWAYILLGVGLLIVVVELFVPSAGILGVLASVFLISSVIVGFVDSMQTGAIVLLILLVSLPLMFLALVKIWPYTPLGRRILAKPATRDEIMPRDEYTEHIQHLVGKVGRAKTKMLPSGIVIIDDRQHDAVSDGFAIEPGDPVKVVAVKFNRIYIQPYNPEDDITTNFNDDTLLDKNIEDLGLESFDS
ncbi:MAG: NfeD family protein [Pirellulaceae bacterium]